MRARWALYDPNHGSFLWLLPTDRDEFPVTTFRTRKLAEKFSREHIHPSNNMKPVRVIVEVSPA